MGFGFGYGVGPVPVTVVQAPAARNPGGGSGPLRKSLPVMVVSLEKKTSTIGALAPWVPWLQTVALAVTLAPGMASGAEVLTEVTTKSGPLPTATRFPTAVLLSSSSSAMELGRSAMAPTYHVPVGGAGALAVCVVHAPGCRDGPGGNCQASWSVPVIASSAEKNRSTVGLSGWVPWLHRVTDTATCPPGAALGAVVTCETTKSGLLPTPISVPAFALLSSKSSGSPLNGSTMAPTYQVPGGGPKKVWVTTSHVPG